MIRVFQNGKILGFHTEIDNERRGTFIECTIEIDGKPVVFNLASGHLQITLHHSDLKGKLVKGTYTDEIRDEVVSTDESAPDTSGKWQRTITSKRQVLNRLLSVTIE